MFIYTWHACGVPDTPLQERVCPLFAMNLPLELQMEEH